MTASFILIGRSGRRHATMTESTRVSTCSIELSSKLRLQLAEPLASTNGMDLHQEKRSPSGLTKESIQCCGRGLGSLASLARPNPWMDLGKSLFRIKYSQSVPRCKISIYPPQDDLTTLGIVADYMRDAMMLSRTWAGRLDTGETCGT